MDILTKTKDSNGTKHNECGERGCLSVCERVVKRDSIPFGSVTGCVWIVDGGQLPFVDFGGSMHMI